MRVKCRREWYDLTTDDVIMYNGSCYQITTRKAGLGWDSSTPILSKVEAVKLIKSGQLKDVTSKHGDSQNPKLVYYSPTE